MRIAYVYDAVHPWETGGVQTRVWELSRRLAEEHDVHWYGMKFWDGPVDIEREGVTLHGVTRPGDLYVGGRRSILEALRFTRHLIRPMTAEQFDVIDCQEFPYFPGFATKLQSITGGSTFVMTWHEVWGDYWYDYLGWKGFAGKAVERLVARLPDAHLAVSEATQRDLRGLGITDSWVVPNGISMAEIQKADGQATPSDVVFVGRLIREKNPDLLVRAIHHLRSSGQEFTCQIVGEGPEAAELDGLIDELDLNDQVTRRDFFQSRGDLLATLKAADVFALPSRREGFGITALEALACGTPVVTIRHPQNAVVELLKDGETGTICDGNPEALSQAILKAKQAISPKKCVESARSYEWDKIVRQVEAFYQEVI